ncbi:MAG: GIY-YIG nuclease family protein [Deltaproteobacteria bacterium]|nr:GIY-YIG nuclease family protein [Deltaproteobacteria bacterium]
MRRFDLKFGPDFLAQVPSAPGVYRFLDADGVVIYVGKAKDLKRRLSQYRNAPRGRRGKKPRAVVKGAVSLTYEVLPTDLDASLEEVRLIQTLRPRHNVASAFEFLYPFIGMREIGRPESTLCELHLVLTSRPELYPEFDHFGVFRSRETVALAFFGLVRLMRHIAHQEPRSRVRAESARDNHSAVLALRRVPRELVGSCRALLRGVKLDLASELAFRLLDKASARAKPKEIQEDLDALRVFFEQEAAPLRRVVEATGYGEWPVPQKERDALFLRARGM